MRTLKTLLISGLVTASFASFSTAFADDWTHLECETGNGGRYIFRFNDRVVDEYHQANFRWDSRCSGRWSCEITDDQIYFTMGELIVTTFLISRRTAQLSWSQRVRDNTQNRLGTCERTTDPLAGPNVF